MIDNREVGGDQQYTEEEIAEQRFASLTPEQTQEREDIVKAIGQRCNALMRYDGKDPALVASALLWCGLSMYAQASEITREGILVVCGTTFDEAKAFVEAMQVEEARKRAERGEPT